MTTLRQWRLAAGTVLTDGQHALLADIITIVALTNLLGRIPGQNPLI